MARSKSVVLQKLAALGFATTLIAAGCSSGASTAPTTAAPATAAPATTTPATVAPATAAATLTVCHDEINLTLPFFVNMKKASEEIAKAYGVNVIWQSADGSLEKEISILQNYVAQGCDAIAIDPLDAKALAPAVTAATAEGIPVVTMGNKVPATGNHNTLYPDYDNFATSAKLMCKAVDGKGSVLLLIGAVGNYVSDTRQAGFLDTMKTECPNVEVLVQPTNWESSTATSVVQTVLTGNPDLAGIAAISDGLTLPALKVLEAQGKLGLPVIGCDGDPAVYPYIDKGQVLSDILTGDLRVGAWNTAVAARLAKGSTFETDLFMPTYFVMSDATATKYAELNIPYVTTEKAVTVATGYLDEFSPDKPDSAMTVK